jgi:hypothetical protein
MIFSIVLANTSVMEILLNNSVAYEQCWPVSTPPPSGGGVNDTAHQY